MPYETMQEVYCQDEDGEETDIVCARMIKADPEIAQIVLDTLPGMPRGNGRTDWLWVRLVDGTLLLATIPQGDTYFETEADLRRP